MAKLECDNCKSVYVDVVKVRKCPLCGETNFSDAEFHVGRMTVTSERFPHWLKREGVIGFYYVGETRIDSRAGLDWKDD